MDIFKFLAKILNSLFLQVEVIGPEGTDGAVHKAGYENLIVAGTALPLEEASGEAPGGVVFFTVVNGKGHEVGAFLNLFCASYCGQEHGASHLNHCASGGLLGQFAGFDFNHSAVRQGDVSAKREELKPWAVKVAFPAVVVNAFIYCPLPVSFDGIRLQTRHKRPLK